MSKKERTPMVGRTLSERFEAPSSSQILINYQRTSVGLTLQANANHAFQAERTFSVDAAYATSRFGMGEVHLVQLLPYDNETASRVVVVKYARDPFKERPTTYDGLLEVAATVRRATEVNLAALGRSAKKDTAQVAAIDADFEVSSFVGTRATITFAHLNNLALSQIIRGANSQMVAFASLEAILSTDALCDLIESWREEAAKL